MEKTVRDLERKLKNNWLFTCRCNVAIFHYQPKNDREQCYLVKLSISVQSNCTEISSAKSIIRTEQEWKFVIRSCR